MKKYEFTGATIEYKGHTLRQIRAIRNFGSITEGTVGGWIEKEENLSHDGTCWVDHAAVVYETARVADDAIVKENAEVHGNAFVCDSARVYGLAEVYGDAFIADHARVHESARVFENAVIEKCCNVLGSAYIRGNVAITDSCTIRSKITLFRDFIALTVWWCDNMLVWTRRDNMWSTDGFFGEAKDLLAKFGTTPEERREVEATIKYTESLLAGDEEE